jgi:hypothetical protein
MRRTNGKKGEIKCQQLICGIFDATITHISKNGKYDFKALFPDRLSKTFEVKTEPKAITQYGGFSVEIGHKQNSYITEYIVRKPFIWDNTKVVRTGLSESEADFYIFHDDKKQYYIVSSKKLKQWVENIIENQQHRVVWGGYQKHTLQIQIRLNELEQLGHYVDLRKKRGKKLTEDKA